MTIDDLAKVGIGIGIVIVIVIGFAFRQRELRSFLDCGVLANGFLRVHCDVCGKDRVVAFSCYPQRETICSSNSALDGEPHEYGTSNG